MYDDLIKGDRIWLVNQTELTEPAELTELTKINEPTKQTVLYESVWGTWQNSVVVKIGRKIQYLHIQVKTW